jgi:outer membrane protein insertion porin family
MNDSAGRITRKRALFAALLRHSLVVVFLAIVGLASAAPQMATAQSYNFAVIKIDGNQRISDSSILAYLGFSTGETVSAAKLNDGYQALVSSGLFEKTEVTPQGRTLLVVVIENPTINRISIEGNKRLDDDKLLPLLMSKPRYVFSATVAQQDAQTLIAAYQSQGRIAATVEPRIIRLSDNRVDLVFEVVEGRNVEVQRVSFVGNRRYSDGRLRRVLETKQAGLLRAIIKSDTFSADRIEFDKQALSDFYMSRGYVDFQILSVSSELSRERDAFFVTFHVQEGQQYRLGAITASTDLPEVVVEDFLAASKLDTGDIYNPAAVENTIARMERLALELRLNFIRVEPVVSRNDRERTLDIDFRITRGPRILVERIDIEGNATTLDRVVRNQFTVVEGDPFNARAIRATAERIRALGYVATADVQAREGSSPDSIIIDVDVEEAPSGSFTFGGAYSLENGLGVNIAFSESNFLGRGQTLNLSLTTGKGNGSFSFSFAEPYLFGRDLRFSLDAYYTQSKQLSELYDTRLAGLRPSLDFPVSENGRVRVSVFGAGGRMFNVAATASPILIAEGARGQQIGAGIGFGYAFDSRRTGLNPTAGVLATINVDLGGFGADYQYAKLSGLARGEMAVLNEEVNLSATIEGGALIRTGGLSSRAIDRFWLGADQMRGFQANGVGPRDLVTGDALGGNYFAVARFEADFPIGLPEEYNVRGGLFLDVGSLWGLDALPADAPSLATVSAQLRSVIGASIFWTTPIGPLRFNFTRALAKQAYDIENRFEFTIATSF